MPFNALEGSVFGRSPIEMYRFSTQNRTWLYTSEDRFVTFNGEVYEPIAGVYRSGIRTTSSIERGELTIEGPSTISIANEFLSAPPSTLIRVDVYQKHRNDSDYANVFSGRLASCAWLENGSKVALKCLRQNTSLKQPGLRRAYQYTCPYVLYESGCNVNKDDYVINTSVTSIVGLVVTLSMPGNALNYFAGGYLLWTNAQGDQDSRMVMSSVNSDVTVQLVTPSLTTGMAVKLYPGCDRQIGTCYSKFNNADRFGGFPFIPDINPFNGSNLF